MRTTSTTSNAPLSPLSRVLPARAAGARDLPALETALASLALDERSPIALELAATGTTREFLLRAEQPDALQHLERQVLARYPQAVIAPAQSDPLALSEGEEWSVLELRPGAPSYLPLRTWRTRDLLEEGADPLLGLLAAFGTLPPGFRTVAQLALLPAAPTWSAPNRRYALEHPLEKERAQARGNAPEHTLKDVLLLLPFVVALLLLYAFHRVLPPWLVQAGEALVHGHAPLFSSQEMTELVVGGGLLLLLLFGVTFALLLLVSRLGAARLYDQRLAEEKTSRPAYRVRLRLFVVGPGAPDPTATRNHPAAPRTWQEQFRTQRARGQARRVRQREREAFARSLAAAYRQYHLASGGYFRPRWLSTRAGRALLRPSVRRGWWHVGWARGLTHASHYLSVADIAALWHLPQAQDLPDLVYVEQTTMRTLLAPAVLAQGDGYALGSSTHAGQTIPVFLPFACLLQNLLVAASTGKGKSTLFASLVCALAQGRIQGRRDVPDGVLLIDPHGDLVQQVAGLLPPALMDDILVINLADREYPIGFNPLDLSQGQDRDLVIDHLIQVIESLWPTAYGPRTESFLEYSCKTLAEANATLIAADPLRGPDQQYTLLDVVPLLRHTSFRSAVLEYVHDPQLLSWWHHYYNLLDGRQQADFTSSLITKVAKFSSSRVIRRILGQPRSTLDLGEIIRQHKLVLFSCASGEIGADMAALFGSLFVGFFQAALQEQARLHQAERHRFLVLIDEFQALSGVNYQTMLAELRKYGGSFALATQSLAYLDRLERTLRATVLANVEHIFAFAMADEDARLLRLPGVEPDDVTQLPNYTCYARLSRNGERLPVFSLRLTAPEVGDDARRAEIVARCRARYAHSVGEVDEILHDCQARQDLVMGDGGGLWDGMGVETVAEVFEKIRKRKRGSGTSKKAEKAGEPSTGGIPGMPGMLEAAPPRHLLYQNHDDLVPRQPDAQAAETPARQEGDDKHDRA